MNTELIKQKEAELIKELENLAGKFHIRANRKRSDEILFELQQLKKQSTVA